MQMEEREELQKDFGIAFFYDKNKLEKFLCTKSGKNRQIIELENLLKKAGAHLQALLTN